MLFLASFILKGPSQAALVAASMAILGLVVPPAIWVSAAAIVLVTLVNGPKSGMVTMVLSLLGAGLFAFLIFSAPQVAMIFVLLAWLPAWLIATILRQTVSLAYSLQVLTVMSLLAVIMVYAVVPDIGELWREPLDSMVEQLAEQSEDFSLAELKQTENMVIKLLPGLFASSIMFGTMLSLLLGRWWQAVFYNPGGFSKEFQSLDLGKVSAMSALAIVLIAMFVDGVFAVAMTAVIFVLYSMQALALLHAAIRIRQINAAWLFVSYLIMFFVPQVLLLLILAGFADPWLDIRQRISKQA
ncbi:MAG: hypothetical protein KAT12_02435 [Gammaproteobacteria bacterium]|nr:hypothetical protein [Gammaproteobacteria bacterium]